MSERRQTRGEHQKALAQKIKRKRRKQRNLRLKLGSSVLF